MGQNTSLSHFGPAQWDNFLIFEIVWKLKKVFRVTILTFPGSKEKILMEKWMSNCKICKDIVSLSSSSMWYQWLQTAHSLLSPCGFLWNVTLQIYITVNKSLKLCFRMFTGCLHVHYIENMYLSSPCREPDVKTTSRCVHYSKLSMSVISSNVR